MKKLPSKKDRKKLEALHYIVGHNRYINVTDHTALCNCGQYIFYFRDGGQHPAFLTEDIRELYRMGYKRFAMAHIKMITGRDKEGFLRYKKAITYKG